MERTDRGRRARAPSLRVGFSWTFTGNVFYAACQMGYVIILAKLGTPEFLGRFALGLAITAPVFMLTNLGLSVALTTDAKGEYDFGEYLGLRLLTTALALAVIASLVAAGGYEWSTAGVLLLVAGAKGVESVSDVYRGLFRRHERMDLVAKAMILKGAASLAVLATLMFLFGRLEWAIAGLGLVWLGVLWFWDRRRADLFTSCSPVFRLARLKPLVVLAFPLGVIAGLNSLGLQLPRYFVETSLGEAGLGLFAAPAAIAAGVAVVTGALSQSTVPRLAHYFAAGEIGRYRVLLVKLTAIGIALGVVGVSGAALLGEWVLALLFGEEYRDQRVVLIWLMVYAAVQSAGSFLGTGLSASRSFRVQTLIHAAKIVTVLVACVVLVPSYGMRGAAWALLAGSLVSVAIYGFVLRRVLAR